ncbi:TetR/AcrR family transcriptional regulator [Pelagicoccus sp. SDUM812002]|nr:TetR/AcrR family transcriptional regulator [Pelagicoccus sp. SDUM812002]MDQ8188351.1 TetR/AcrR family transcriptional regulator [Pelagicoccus sp. SDUM812002]
MAFLTERGYSAAGVNDILAAAGVPKGSFYHYFRSKADFGSQLIDAYATYFAKKLDRSLSDELRDPLDRLKAFVDDAAEGMARHGFNRGCLVGNLGQEMGLLPDDFREKLQAVFASWEARVCACLEMAQEKGEISCAQNAYTLARFFWIGWEGAVLRAKLDRCRDPLDTFASGFFSMIES